MLASPLHPISANEHELSFTMLSLFARLSRHVSLFCLVTVALTAQGESASSERPDAMSTAQGKPLPNPLNKPQNSSLSTLPVVDDSRGVVILQYHHVSTSTPPITSTTPEMFETHMKLIEEEGFQVKSLPWVVERLQQKQPIDDKTVVITFDDGYLSIYESAFPLLKARNWPFTIFVCPGPIDQKFSDSVTWEQLQEMQAAGATIANHSFHHDYLVDRKVDENGVAENDDQWLNRVRTDILSTEARIKEALGVEHKLLAYPYGEFTDAMQGMLKEEGFVAFGQQSGAVGYFSEPTSLARYPAAGIYANPATLKTKLYTLPFHVVEEPKKSLLLEGEVPELTVLMKPNGFRRAQVQCYYQGQPIDTQVTDETVNGESLIRITAQAEQLGRARRHRYNCTAPTMNGKRYYWYSHSWVRSSEHDG